MRFSVNTGLIITIFCYGSFTLAYNPDDLDKFNRTGHCRGCDLSNASLTGLHGYIESADLSGANLSNAGVLFVGPKANFSNINGTNARFSSNFVEAKFNGAKLVNARFAHFAYNKSDFSNADVRGVDFYRASLLGANITMGQLATASNICAAILPDGSKGSCK